MKSAIELVWEVDGHRRREEEALLLVGFPKTTRIVSSNSPDGLHLLEELLEQGGIPVGQLNVEKIDGEEYLHSRRVFDDRLADQWAEPYMSTFVERYIEDAVDDIGIDEFRVQ